MFTLDDILFEKLLIEARKSARKRVHYNLHKDYSEPVQRLCIALINGTYVRPHSHMNFDGWEMILVLRGHVVMLIFDESGCVKDRIEMSPDSGRIGVEMKPNTWHMLFPLSSDAIIFEVKEGPYKPKKNSDFANWSPEENSNEVVKFLAWAQTAVIGDQF